MSKNALAPLLPSDRKFGLFFSGVFVLLAAWAVWKQLSTWVVVAELCAAAGFAIAALAKPSVLAPLNRLWFRLGLILGRVVSPVVLGLMFFLLITPFGLIGRLAGRDVLRLRKRNVESYWIERESTGLAPESFKQQF